MKALYCLKIIAPALALVAVPWVVAQERSDTMQHSPGATSLASLIEEAKAKSPQILAANHAYKASSHAPASAAALPDTQVMVQHLSVGSPRPFAGYTNSDFAYIGLGASQEFPYPGKRKLRAEVAGQEARGNGPRQGHPLPCRRGAKLGRIGPRFARYGMRHVFRQRTQMVHGAERGGRAVCAAGAGRGDLAERRGRGLGQ